MNYQSPDFTNVINSDGSLPNQIHETTHAIEHVNGDIYFKEVGTTLLFDKKRSHGLSEADAYATQFVITRVLPYSTRGGIPLELKNIIPLWVSGILGLDGQPVYPDLYNRYK